MTGGAAEELRAVDGDPEPHRLERRGQRRDAAGVGVGAAARVSGGRSPTDRLADIGAPPVSVTVTVTGAPG